MGHTVALTLGSAFALPTVIAMAWNDPFGGYVYGALLARVMSQFNPLYTHMYALNNETSSVALYLPCQLVGFYRLPRRVHPLILLLLYSLAHWDGIQQYSDENTSKTKLVGCLLVEWESD